MKATRPSSIHRNTAFAVLQELKMVFIFGATKPQPVFLSLFGLSDRAAIKSNFFNH